MSDYLRREMIQALKSGDAVLVVGAGVAMTASGSSAAASWNGLLELGITRCVDLNKAFSGAWETARRAELASSDPTDKLTAAQHITRELQGFPGNHYSKWLRDTVGSLDPSAPGIAQVLAGFQVPILTTNYDGLIEKVSGREATTWQDLSEIQEEVRNPGKYVVHLHGHWRQPGSVIFGYESYSRLIGDERSQALLRALISVKSIIFVGFGGGLSDPNFTSLGTWLTSTLRESGIAPLVLVREADYEQAEPRYRQNGYNTLSYGAEYEDLEIYLANLLAECTGVAAADQPCIEFTWDALAPKLMRLHRRIDRDYKPDFIVAMSGPGNLAPAYCLAHSSNDPPLLTAVTFPKRPHRSASSLAFRDIARTAKWIYCESLRWDIYLPNVIKHFPHGSRALLFDDRAVGGRAQKMVAELLATMGYEVRRAALVVHPDCAADIDYYEEVVSGDFVFPWGGKYGRNEPPAR
jgi:adenine/guanine phosphoribosyltransferase-like PRPP-binding protein